MAAIVITAANVAYVSGPVKADQVAGGVFTAGQAVYQAANGTWLKAQGDGTTIEAGEYDLGVALFTADAVGARGTIAVTGAKVAYGAVLTAGLFYTIGDTAGSIYPSADNGSTDKVTLLGMACSTSQLLIQRLYDAGAVIA